MDEPMEPPEYAYDSSGVDVTLIRWMLDMTPAERRLAQRGVDFLVVGGVGAILIRHALEDSRGSTARNEKKPIS